MGQHDVREGGLAARRRLQEGAGRQRHHGAPDADGRLHALRHQFAVPGDAGEPMRLGDAGERRRHLRGERARTAHVYVDAGVGRGRLDVERLAGAPQGLGDRPCGVDDAVEAGRQNRTAVDRHDAVGAECSKAHFENVVGAAAGMKHAAPAALAMGVDRRSPTAVGAAMPASASASTTRSRFQSR